MVVYGNGKKPVIRESTGPLQKVKKDLYPEQYKKKTFLEKIKKFTGYKVMGPKSPH